MRESVSIADASQENPKGGEPTVDRTAGLIVHRGHGL